MTIFSLVVVIGVPWCQENIGSFDLMAGRRSCGAAPSEIRVWASEHNSRRAEDIDNLQKWIARHPGQINKQYGAFCDTPLHFAARFGREDVADALIAGGADVNAPNKRDERPLHTSATYGHPSVAQALLSRRAEVNVTDRGGNTPLHSAASGLGGQDDVDGRVRVARLLLAAGARVNARNPGGFTPLRYAWMNRNTTMVEVLLAYGADPRSAEEPSSGADGRAR